MSLDPEDDNGFDLPPTPLRSPGIFNPKVKIRTQSAKTTQGQPEVAESKEPNLLALVWEAAESSNGGLQDLLRTAGMEASQALPPLGIPTLESLEQWVGRVDTPEQMAKKMEQALQLDVTDPYGCYGEPPGRMLWARLKRKVFLRHVASSTTGGPAMTRDSSPKSSSIFTNAFLEMVNRQKMQSFLGGVQNVLKERNFRTQSMRHLRQGNEQLERERQEALQSTYVQLLQHPESFGSHEAPSFLNATNQYVSRRILRIRGIKKRPGLKVLPPLLPPKLKQRTRVVTDENVHVVDMDRNFAPSPLRNSHHHTKVTADSVQLAYWAQGKMPDKTFQAISMRHVVPHPWNNV